MPNVRSIPSAAQGTPSQKTLLDLKRLVAAPVGAKDNPDEVRATDGIHMAIDWLMEWEWEWFLLDGLTFDTAVGTANYTITQQNGGIRTLRNVRVSTGTQRPLWQINEDLYNRIVHDQTATSLPVYYALTRLGQNQQITLLPTPDRVETIQYNAYTEPVKETSDNATLLLPSWLESPLILRAQALVALWRNERSVSTDLFALSEAARRGAAARDRAPIDNEIHFVSFEDHTAPRGTLDVEPSYWNRFE